MLQVWRKSDAALRYISNDCAAAISANPRNEKTEEYLRDMRKADAELDKRQQKRIARRELRSTVFDPLTVPIRRRRFVANTDFQRKCFNEACYEIGWYRLTRPIVRGGWGS